MKKSKILFVLSVVALFSSSYSNKLNHYHINDNIEKKINNYSKNENIEKLIKEEMFNLTNSNYYSIEYLTFAKDFAGNIFAVAKFSPKGFAILNLTIGEFMEISTNAEFPYELDDVKGKYYIPLDGFYDENGVCTLEDNLKIPVSNNERSLHLKDLEFTSNELSKNYYKYVNETNLKKLTGQMKIKEVIEEEFPITPFMTRFNGEEAPKAKYEVPYSRFFRLNDNEFPKNSNYQGGNCGYVVMSMLLWYADMFESAGYIREYDYDNFITITNGEYGKCVPIFSNEFIDEHWPFSSGLVPLDAGDLIDEYLNGSGIDYDCKTTILFFSKGIDDILAEGIPVGYFGNLPVDTNNDKGHHAITVYGSYGNGKILAHYGWPGYHQVIISKASMFELGGYVYIENYEPHHHRKYIKNGDLVYCGCGYLMEC